MKEENSGHGGMSLLEVLAVVFVVLKLCDVITWSWIWVLAPIWIEILYVIIALIVVAFIFHDIR